MGEDRRAEVRRRRRLRPSLAALEGRRLLSTIVVDNPTDTPVPGQIDLRQAIEMANANGSDETIAFDNNAFRLAQTIKLTSGQLELTDTTGTVSIEGPASGLTISGGNASRVFQVDNGVTAKISDLTVSGGSTTQLSEVIDQDGAGIRNLGTLQLLGVVLSENAVGGFDSFGGGLANEGSATLVDCVVTGNTSGDGAGVFNNGTITMERCTVDGNASWFGATNTGGIFNAGTATLDDCTVSGNNGTGVYCTLFFASGTGVNPPGTMTMDHCSIDDNTGDGLWSYLSRGELTLVDCSLSGNGMSGEFNYRAPLSMTGCTVEGNGFRYPGSGGGVATADNLGTATITDCTISGNYGNGLFNGAFGGAAKATVTNCIISKNQGAPYLGGGVWNESGATLSLRGCEIEGNVAATYGGGVTNSGQLSVTGCLISGNSAGSYGGGISVYAGSLTISDSLMTGNVAGDQGGGLFVDGQNQASATLDDVILEGNSAATGGGVYNSGTLAATGGLLANNSATDGGGIFNSGALMLSSAAVIRNAAAHDGGGLVNHGTATLTDCLLAANSAGSDGGGIFNDGIAALSDCIVTGNAAALGGGIYEAPDGTLTLVRTKVVGNRGGNVVDG